MAESQLMCMEDGHIAANIPETNPKFYYSEVQRAAIEQLLKNGDGAFKTRLKEDKVKDFLSAREIKLVTSTFSEYNVDSDDRQTQESSSKTDGDSGVHSTYWPQLSDTEVPSLDIGWPSGGFFRGVTRVAVHTHPPKDDGPHIKEVVRRLIQEANKVIAIVMDLLTDLQIIQDLLDVAFRRSVAVYIVLDEHGVPHFLDMCSRIGAGAHHLRNIRCRSLEGIGLGLSFGKIPGSLCNKYMLVDGDTVMFGSLSFSWCSSRMDRNMITVMSGQVVDVFDRDFRELYAISQEVNLYKEFHVERPSRTAPPKPLKVDPKRPPIPVTTSRFQVTLGDSNTPNLQVPAHKFYNPKYALVFGEGRGPTGSYQGPTDRRDLTLAREVDTGSTRDAIGKWMDKLDPLPPDEEEGGTKPKKSNGVGPKPSFNKKPKWKWPSKKSTDGPSASPDPSPNPVDPSLANEDEDNLEVIVKIPAKRGSRRFSKMGSKSESVPAVNKAQDTESLKSKRRSKKPGCTQS